MSESQKEYSYINKNYYYISLKNYRVLLCYSIIMQTYLGYLIIINFNTICKNNLYVLLVLYLLNNIDNIKCFMYNIKYTFNCHKSSKMYVYYNHKITLYLFIILRICCFVVYIILMTKTCKEHYYLEILMLFYLDLTLFPAIILTISNCKSLLKDKFSIIETVIEVTNNNSPYSHKIIYTIDELKYHNNKCTICYNNNCNTIINICDHQFCDFCVNKIKQCPLCRKYITDVTILQVEV